MINSLALAYLEAFRGSPWFEDSLTIDEVMTRLECQFRKPGFRLFILESNSGELVAASWFDTPSLMDIKKERGAELRNFAESVKSLNNIDALIWEREVLVRPKYQGLGMGTEIRTKMLDFINQTFASGLVLTRMREDNIPIIKIAEKLGFKRTGITKPSSQEPAINHEYWFRMEGGK